MSEDKIIFYCLGCQSPLEAPAEYVGCKVRCDSCNLAMLVPGRGQSAQLYDEETEKVKSPPVSQVKGTATAHSRRGILAGLAALCLIAGLGAFYLLGKSGARKNGGTAQFVGESLEQLNSNPKLFEAKHTSQQAIAVVDKMVDIPKPLIVRDWQDVSQKYYKYILRDGYELDGHLLMKTYLKGKESGHYAIKNDYLKTSNGDSGWKREMFANREFKGKPEVMMIDKDLNFNWGHKKPHDAIDRDNFSVRWSTVLDVPESREYTFYLRSDDGSRMFINGKELMGHMRGLAKLEKKIHLEQGRKYEILVEYVESSGEAKAILTWDYISATDLAEKRMAETYNLRMPSYRHSKPGGEIFTNVSPIVGAKMVGLDPRDLVDFDILKSAKLWFDEKHGIYRHGPGDKNPELHSGIYGYWSSVYGVMLADLFPDDTDFMVQVKKSTQAFLKIAKGLGCPDEANFDTLGFNFETNGPGGRNEPMNRFGNSPIVAWMNLLGYDLHKDPEMLACAESAMRYYELNAGRYELTHIMGPYVASRLMVEHGKDFDLGKIYNAWFGGEQERGWHITAGKEYKGVTVDGLDGAVWKNGNFLCFTMGSLNGPAWLLPALRYDPDYAVAVAKYSLNMAVSMRLMQGYKMDWNHQDHKDWKDLHDPDYLLFYEALGTSEFSDKRLYQPYATGDPIRLGWGTPKVERKDYLKQKKEWFSKTSNNIGLYMGNHVGLLGAIVAKTDVDAILRWDCTKTEWLVKDSYPTFLYHNPHAEAKSVRIDLSDKIDQPVDIYDTISGQFLISAFNGSEKLKLKANQAVVLVAVPQGAKLSRKGKHLLANNRVIDFKAH
ncbi:PA14 domain-containing protein [Lentisphaera marina]|uniref:PA14 domain-containing protein n=1 Tax=Lentisphaera marina TaxID=1111041 RepID=UPI002366CEE1|nr:PA14 domain-containing protein [Lentisphaera marina]MDD7984948.1 PA14 domain-containing protein [Lentisphaera marina]